jgi:hypothetical protein
MLTEVRPEQINFLGVPVSGPQSMGLVFMQSSLRGVQTINADLNARFGCAGPNE